MDKIKLLIDTDIGGDIDDALCLAMALNSKEVDLLGVTTVYAGSQWRTDLTLRMLKAYAREDVSVRRGAERPLVGRYPHDKGIEPLENEAVPFIINTCRENPGMTLLAIGPLTNVALALHLAPDIKKTTDFVIMGGMIGSAQPEWNILCDPEAAATVLEQTNPHLIGLDITEQCRLDKEQADSLVRGDTPQMAILQEEMGRFFNEFDFLPVLHDPLALACLLREDLVTFEPRMISVETKGQHTRGTTVWNRHTKDSNIRYGTKVKAREATEFICKRVRGEN